MRGMGTIKAPPLDQQLCFDLYAASRAVTAAYRPVLTRLGINERANALSAANPGSAADIKSARARLVEATQMGNLFKAFCAASPGLMPQGFEP